MYFSKSEFETALKGTDNRIRHIKNELAKIGTAKLICRTRGNRTYFSERTEGHEHGISKNKSRIHALVKREYLDYQLRALNHNRELLRRCLKSYNDIDPEQIILKMCAKHHFIPIEDILLYNKSDWGKQPYEKNPFYPENLKYVTTNNLPVRSKSERDIANALEELSIEFRYDALIDCVDVSHYADFLIRRPNGTLLIWEHFGREHDREYMAKNRERIKDYISIGYRPWNNLVWTLESDLLVPGTIRKIIRRFILSEMDRNEGNLL